MQVLFMFAILMLSSWGMVGNRIARLSTHPIPQRQPVSFVSLLRHTINKCELLRTHNRHKRELLAGRMYHLAPRRRRQPGTIMPDTKADFSGTILV